MDELHLEVSASPADEDIDAVIDGVRAFNQGALESGLSRPWFPPRRQLAASSNALAIASCQRR
jgi:hypothetical protein